MLAGKWLDKPEIHVQEYLGPEIWSGRQVLLADNGREPSSKTLIIRNPGNQSLTISPGSVPNGFIVQDFSDSPLAPGQAKAFTVAINPAVSGYQSGAFRIMTNDGNEQLFVIPLREAAPEVDVVDVQDGGTFTFPEDAVVGDTLEYEFTIKNIGFPALEVSAPQITAPFTLVSGSFPAAIRSGRPKTFTVQVDTSVADTLTGTFSFTTNDPNENPFNFDLVATVKEPEPEIQLSRGGRIVSLPGEPINFGEVRLNESLGRDRRLIRVENIGTAPLDWSAVVSNADFSVGGVYPAVVQHNDPTVVFLNVFISGTTAGSKNATLSVMSDDSDEPLYTFPLTGSVTADPILGPQITIDVAAHGGTYPFGESPTNQAKRRQFTITNTGDERLDISSITAGNHFEVPVGGANPSFPLTVAANGGTQTFFVDMKKTPTDGPKTGTLRIYSNASPSPYVVNLTGSVKAAPIGPPRIIEQHLFSLDGSPQLINTADGGRVNATPSDVIRVIVYDDGTHRFEKAFDGAAHDLAEAGENIDGFARVGNSWYFSTNGEAHVGNGFIFQQNDIARYEAATGTWELVFDGNNALGGNNIDAIAALSGNRFLISIDDNDNNNPAGSIASSDLLMLFAETGKMIIALDGSKHGLDNTNEKLSGRPGDENVDAVTNFEGKYLVSTSGFASLGRLGTPAHSADAEDVSMLSGDTWTAAFIGGDYGFSGVNVDGYQREYIGPRVAAQERVADFGDAPVQYPTARHIESSGSPILGTTIDFEFESQSNNATNGDDIGLYFFGETGPRGDEDDVTIPDLIVGQTMELSIQTSGASGDVDGWIDFNGDGDWDDPGEHIVAGRNVASGTQTYSFAVPADAVLQDTYARFRIAETAVGDSSVTVTGGEVEDYLVEFVHSDFLVTNTLDSGSGSLRQAILDANQATQTAQIVFAIPDTDANYVDVDSSLVSGDAAPDTFRITPTTGLPWINNVNGHAVSLDATTQHAFTGDTNPNGPEIELDGSAVAGGGAVYHGQSCHRARVQRSQL